MEVIDLCLSSDEEDASRQGVPSLTLAGKSCTPVLAGKKRTGKAKLKAEPKKGRMMVDAAAEDFVEDDDDGEVEIVPVPTAASASSIAAGSVPAAASAPSLTDHESDVVMVKEGINPLIDFPHARENCMVHSFVADPMKSCANCYCYVCDKPQSVCKEWTTHCRATHTDRKWRQMRHACQQQMPIAAASAAAVVMAGSNMSVEKILKAVQQVYPVETPKPAGMVVANLRPYQKQSLAFMLRNERAPSDSALVGCVEREEVRGGWLCSEVGMGKTAVCIALILANPSKDPTPCDALWTDRILNSINPIPKFIAHARYGGYTTYVTNPSKYFVNPNWEAFEAQCRSKVRLQLKTTVVFTTNSLLVQWKDEIHKFAPGLKVLVLHGAVSTADGGCKSDSDFFRGRTDLRQYDVLLTTLTMKFPEKLTRERNIYFHRIIVDEQHTTSKSIHSFKSRFLTSFNGRFKWAVTATPASGSSSDLGRWARVLGQYDRLFGPSHLLNTKGGVDRLKELMIRHTKGMQIGGEKALALPVLDSQTAGRADFICKR